MDEWANLPKELLDSVARRLSSDIDVIRFRSVCSTWRSSVSYPLHYLIPNCLPIHPSVTATNLPGLGFFSLSRRVIYRLKQPEISLAHNTGTTSNQGWIIKLEEDVPGKLHLLNPLTETIIDPLPTTFPKVWDSSNLQIFQLAEEFVLRFTNRPSVTIQLAMNHFIDNGDLYMEKVVFSSSPPWCVDTDFVIMTIHVSGKLALFRSRDNSWSLIDDFPCPYDDVIRYKGGFYAVDNTGRTVVVDPSLTVTEVAFPVFGGDKKCLVELDGELLLVDRYLPIGPDDDPSVDNDNGDEEVYGNNDTYVFDTTLWFKVFKLDEGERQWIEVKTLGDGVVFLGDNCSFSASASDLPGCKGSCIFFTDKFFRLNKEEDGVFKAHDLGIFNLEDGSIGPLVSYPNFSKLFWPPPAWITSVTCEPGSSEPSI